MITRMLLSLKRTSAKGLDQGWGVGENDEDDLDLPSNSRITHCTVRFSGPVPRAQGDKAIPIAMEML